MSNDFQEGYKRALEKINHLQKLKNSPEDIKRWINNVGEEKGHIPAILYIGVSILFNMYINQEVERLEASWGINRSTRE